MILDRKENSLPWEEVKQWEILQTSMNKLSRMLFLTTTLVLWEARLQGDRVFVPLSKKGDLEVAKTTSEWISWSPSSWKKKCAVLSVSLIWFHHARLASWLVIQVTSSMKAVPNNGLITQKVRIWLLLAQCVESILTREGSKFLTTRVSKVYSNQRGLRRQWLRKKKTNSMICLVEHCKNLYLIWNKLHLHILVLLQSSLDKLMLKHQNLKDKHLNNLWMLHKSRLQMMIFNLCQQE